MATRSLTSIDRLERRLLILAGSFLALYALALTLSNAVRLRSWQVDYRWGHWVGMLVWLGVIWVTHRQLRLSLPNRDPTLFAIIALLSGWGLLTIWRLSSVQALRQTAWLVLVGMVFILGLRFDCKISGGRILSYLRRFKYVWLTSGLVLTTATLFMGVNPLGSGPRMWLGCCGIYFQPSEPLKLLLIIYLSAYLADRHVTSQPKTRLFPLLTPTLVMTGLALLLLIFQRDLGTAAIFLMLYAVIVYAGTENKIVLFTSLAAVLLAALVGYLLFDVVSQRVQAWINPWLDPSGGSYQIVQSLLAVANGGILGRGPGMGSPNLVPIAQSDFIYSAIGEESGLIGALGILGLLTLIVNRGMRIAQRAQDLFQRLLAIGLVTHLVGQSLLIIAGNLRLLPLTGVTLPFVSNGGSSLLVSYFELLCLLLISARQEQLPTLLVEDLKSRNKINLLLTGGMLLGLAGAALLAGWWSLVRGADLLSRTDNPRRSIADRYVTRGSIIDRSEHPLAESSGRAGEIIRRYPYPALGPLVGYTDPIYGQAGLEASLDPYLRGLKGYPTLTINWMNLLYGQPPPGLNVRLSLDLDLQIQADQLLAGHRGALVLVNASTGEVLAMATHPSFDANTLDANWEQLVNDPNAPLFNRSTMGLYPAGNALGGFLLATDIFMGTEQYDAVTRSDCAVPPAGTTFADAVAAGCGAPIKQLVNAADKQTVLNLLDELGFFNPPIFPVEALSTAKSKMISDIFRYLQGLEIDPVTGTSFKVSPLQMALAAATLSNNGEKPNPRITMAVANPNGGWVILPAEGQPQQVLASRAAVRIADALSVSSLPVWQTVSVSTHELGSIGSTESTRYTWYLGGTGPDWKGAKLAVAILLEEDNPKSAQEMGQQIFRKALYP